MPDYVLKKFCYSKFPKKKVPDLVGEIPEEFSGEWQNKFPEELRKALLEERLTKLADKFVEKNRRKLLKEAWKFAWKKKLPISKNNSAEIFHTISWRNWDQIIMFEDIISRIPSR